jgi:hypothetical protein
MLQTLGDMFTNSKKNNNAFIILQCCVIITNYNEITCAMTRWMTIIKLGPSISCAYTHPLHFCSRKKKHRKKKTKEKNMKKIREKEKKKQRTT